MAFFPPSTSGDPQQQLFQQLLNRFPGLAQLGGQTQRPTLQGNNLMGGLGYSQPGIRFPGSSSSLAQQSYPTLSPLEASMGSPESVTGQMATGTMGAFGSVPASNLFSGVQGPNASIGLPFQTPSFGGGFGGGMGSPGLPLGGAGGAGGGFVPNPTPVSSATPPTGPSGGGDGGAAPGDAGAAAAAAAAGPAGGVGPSGPGAAPGPSGLGDPSGEGPGGPPGGAPGDGGPGDGGATICVGFALAHIKLSLHKFRQVRAFWLHQRRNWLEQYEDGPARFKVYQAVARQIIARLEWTPELAHYLHKQVIEPAKTPWTPVRAPAIHHQFAQTVLELAKMAQVDAPAWLSQV